MIERFAANAARLDVPLSATTLETPGIGFDVLINATAASLQAAVPPLPAGTLDARRARARHDVRPPRRCPS